MKLISSSTSLHQKEWTLLAFDNSVYITEHFGQERLLTIPYEEKTDLPNCVSHSVKEGVF